jgi:hypothetical protein
MYLKRLFIIIFISLFAGNLSSAQQRKAAIDTTRRYENIESYSGRSKFTQFMYRLVFKPVAPNSKKDQAMKKAYRKLLQNPYAAFEGKTIRNINIITLDPFKTSIADTVVISPNILARTGNTLHIKSRQNTIRNLLLIHQNQVFDSLLVRESERLVRSKEYVTEVLFIPKTVSKNSDSVDIDIRELDSWSIIPKVTNAKSYLTINLMDKNMLGLGHTFENDFIWLNSNDDFAYNTYYFIPNIRNSYISAAVNYGTDEFRNFTKSIAVERPFFSPYSEWAAGLKFMQQTNNVLIVLDDTLSANRKLKFNTQDYWAGNAMQIFNGNTEYIRSTRFISTFRYSRIRYMDEPGDNSYIQNYFSNEDLYLVSFGIATRKYLRDKYIFKFGVTEDVPVGKVYSLTGGYQNRAVNNRVYLGARISLGNFFSWGYLSTNYEFGTFVRESKAEQGVFSVGMIYFTGLLKIGDWKFRQFVKPQLTYGINRFTTDSLTLNEGNGLGGFNSIGLTGTNRLIFTLQTQSYSPWNFIGFRFGPFLVYSAGMIGDAASGFKNSKVYSQIGLGVLIKNVNLVINTFQLSIAFYPVIPGIGRNEYKINSFRTADFSFRDFDIGKPETLIFQ